MKILNETLDAHLVNPLNENMGNDMSLEDKFKSLKSKKSVESALFKLTKSLTSKVYTDEDWSGIRNIIHLLKKTGAEVEVNVDNGGYRTHKDGSQTKVYNVDYNLENNFGNMINIRLYITAYQAGTVEYPWDSYDLTITM